MRGLTRGTTLVLLLALLGSACAGEVGKYRNAAPGTNAVTAGAPQGGPAEVAEAEAVLVAWRRGDDDVLRGRSRLPGRGTGRSGRGISLLRRR